jgi:hypothetical protein
MGNTPLCDLYPRLFSISSQKEARISDVRISHEGEWRWELMWRRRLFVWEEELIVGLRVALPSLVLSDVEDDWSWLPGEMGMFSVHSVYFTLGSVLPPVVVFSEFELEVFSNMW